MFWNPCAALCIISGNSVNKNFEAVTECKNLYTVEKKTERYFSKFITINLKRNPYSN